MKKIAFYVTLLAFTVNSFSQTPALSKDYYLQKSKNQKTTGWVLLIGGTIMAAGGLIGVLKNFDEGSTSATNISAVIALAGVAADLVSIPFFINSSKNKKKAAAITINHQNIYLPQQNSVALKVQPAVTLKIRL